MLLVAAVCTLGYFTSLFFPYSQPDSAKKDNEMGKELMTKN